MQTKPAQSDPFNLEPDTEDEFAPAPAAELAPADDALAHDPATVHDDPFVGIARSGQPDDSFAAAQPSQGSDPFAGIARSSDDAAPAVAQIEDPAAATDPFDELPPPKAREEIDDGENAIMAADPTPAPAAAIPEAIVSTSLLGEAVAPRITVHAFCANDATIDTVRSAAGDRRMERASTVVRPGGLPGAVDFYQNQPTPSLVIVEATQSSADLLDGLNRLAEVCDPGTKVVVIGAANDIALYRELMRQGVSDYLVPPLSTLQVIGAITSLYADPAAPFVGRQITFCGAKGGVGSSTLAHNIAYELSERMTAATVLVDLDLAFGTAALDFNHDPVQGVADALSQPDRLDPVLMDRMMAKHSDHLSLFAAPATLDQDYDITSDVFEEVVRKIRMHSPFVVLDLPHSWGRWTRRMLLTSDDLVIVAEPDLACLRNAKNIVDLVRAARPNDPPPRVVLNKVGVPSRPEIPLKDFGEALGLTPCLSIPFDAKTFGQAANNGQMIAGAGVKSKAVEAVDQLIRMMLNQRAPAPQAPSKASTVLSGLFKRK